MILFISLPFSLSLFFFSVFRRFISIYLLLLSLVYYEQLPVLQLLCLFQSIYMCGLLVGAHVSVSAYREIVLFSFCIAVTSVLFFIPDKMKKKAVSIPKKKIAFDHQTYRCPPAKKHGITTALKLCICNRVECVIEIDQI